MPANQTIIQRRGRPTVVGQGKPSRTGRALKLPLTKKQEAFILAWMVRRSSTQAYLDSHPQAGYETARTEGSRLFRDPRIASLIQTALSEERERLESNGRRVSDTLAAMAFSAISDVFAKDGTMIAPEDMPREVAVAVRKVKRREIVGKADAGGKRVVIGQAVEIEMHDKVRALQLLGIQAGMFKDKVKISLENELLQAMQEGRKRALQRPNHSPDPGSGDGNNRPVRRALRSA